MTTVKLLPQFAIPSMERSMCEADVGVAIDLRGRRKKHGTSCGNVAKLVIDGKALCIRHAQARALEILLKEVA